MADPCPHQQPREGTLVYCGECDPRNAPAIDPWPAMLNTWQGFRDAVAPLVEKFERLARLLGAVDEQHRVWRRDQLVAMRKHARRRGRRK